MNNMLYNFSAFPLKILTTHCLESLAGKKPGTMLSSARYARRLELEALTHGAYCIENFAPGGENNFFNGRMHVHGSLLEDDQN